MRYLYLISEKQERRPEMPLIQNIPGRRAPWLRACWFRYMAAAICIPSYAGLRGVGRLILCGSTI